MRKMENKILENEKKILQELFDLNKKIYKLYQKLINEPENSEKIIDYLNICFELEESYYDKLDNNRLDIYLNYIDVKFLKEIDDYNITISDFYELSLKKRIYARLEGMKEETILQALENNGYSLDSDYLKIIYSKILDEDFKSLYIYFINELTKDDNNKEFKRKLEKAKYLMCFLNPNLENIIINQDKTFVSSFLFKNIKNISDDNAKILVNTYINHYLMKYFELFLSIKDENFENRDIYFKSLLYIALIKTCYEMNDDIKINEKNVDNSKSKEILKKIKENKGSYDFIKLDVERHGYESSR